MRLRLFFAAFLIFNLPAFSQKDAKPFNMLLTAGITGCQVHGDSYSGYDKLGGTAGVGVSYEFSKKFAASFGMLFIQKGAKHNQDPAKGDLHYYNLSLNYVELPLLFTYTYKKLMIDVGASAGYLISYHEVNETGDITGYNPFKKMEYSVKGGIGYKLSERWFVNLRSSNSFITIRPYKIPSTIYYNNIVARAFNKGLYNNILELTLGFKIKPGNKSEQQ